MKKLGFSIALSMVAATLLSLMPVMPVSAIPNIYMVPVSPPGPLSVGYKWNITFWVTGYGTPGVFAWQVGIKYDINMLKVNRGWVLSTDPNYIFKDEAGVKVPVVSIDNVAGISKVGDSLTTDLGAVPPPEPAVLGKVEFEILRAPAKATTDSCVLDIDHVDTYLLDDNLNEIPRTATNGSYSWTWSPPPPPNPSLYVDPDPKELNPGPSYNVHVIGNTFTVDIRMKNLNGLWGITTASFTITFDSTVIDTNAGQVTINVVDWDGLWVVTVTHGPPDTIDISVSTTKSLSGDLLIATIEFTVMNQLDSPPAPAPPAGRLESNLAFSNVLFRDHIQDIPQGTHDDGKVIVYNYRALELAWLSVEPKDTVLGPELVIGEQFGKLFTLGVKINQLDKAWKMVGAQFRLQYNPALLQVVSISQGPYMEQFADYGKWFFGSVEPAGPLYPQHVLVGVLILPDENGTWHDWAGDTPRTGPLGSGILATITFKPIKQSWTLTYTSKFGLFDMYGVNTDGDDVAFDYGLAVNGTYTILPIAPTGRVIDLWTFDPALGGQGPGAPADLVLPQMALNLTAKVTYNWQPIAYKKVTFEIRGPMACGGQDPSQAHLWAVLQDDTCDNGHAYAFFRMPWTGHTAEELIGVWWIGVSVTLADVVITDYMEFDYDYLIHIWSVTTDKLEYYKSNDVKVTVTFGTKSTRTQTVTMYATLMDELGVPIGIASKTLDVGGASLCHYKNYTTTVVSHVPFWAYAGLATVHVSFVWGLPSQNGEACAQERDANFWILPVHWDDPWLTDP